MNLLRYSVTVVLLLLEVAYVTLCERVILGSIQRRVGPNYVGLFGIGQAIADAIKLIAKESIYPVRGNTFIFLISPLVTFIACMVSWIVLPLGFHLTYISISLEVIGLLALSSLGIYGIILSGWSSNSKYSFLGGIRSSAQMISYEVSMGLLVISLFLFSSSISILPIVEIQETIWIIVPLVSIFIVYSISCLAETNRPPFDLPEEDKANRPMTSKEIEM